MPQNKAYLVKTDWEMRETQTALYTEKISAAIDLLYKDDNSEYNYKLYKVKFIPNYPPVVDQYY